jgi:hypothetical protein
MSTTCAPPRASEPWLEDVPHDRSPLDWNAKHPRALRRRLVRSATARFGVNATEARVRVDGLMEHFVNVCEAVLRAATDEEREHASAEKKEATQLLDELDAEAGAVSQPAFEKAMNHLLSSRDVGRTSVRLRHGRPRAVRRRVSPTNKRTTVATSASGEPSGPPSGGTQGKASPASSTDEPAPEGIRLSHTWRPLALSGTPAGAACSTREGAA